MTAEERLQPFKWELLAIGPNDYQELAKEVLLRLPNDSLWTMSASSSGKYHLPDEQGKGGLLLHTKRVVKVAVILCQAHIDINTPAVLCGALLHDIARYGLQEEPSEYSLSEHPTLAAGFIILSGIGTQWKVAELVERHMGRWGKVKPDTLEEWTVHTADMIASQYTPSMEMPKGIIMKA